MFEPSGAYAMVQENEVAAGLKDRFGSGGRESRCSAVPMLPGNAAGCFYFMADRLMPY
jgi:hypothetical protein